MDDFFFFWVSEGEVRRKREKGRKSEVVEERVRKGHILQGSF